MLIYWITWWSSTYFRRILVSSNFQSKFVLAFADIRFIVHKRTPISIFQQSALSIGTKSTYSISVDSIRPSNISFTNRDSAQLPFSVR